MAIDRIPGVGPTNADIATAVAAPSAATIASAVAAPSAATIATAVAAAVPTTAGITSIVQANAGSPYGGTLTNLGFQSMSGVASVTFSSLGSYKYLKILGINVSPATAIAKLNVRFNGDGGTNYKYFVSGTGSSGTQRYDTNSGTANAIIRTCGVGAGPGNDGFSMNTQVVGSNSSAHKILEGGGANYDSANGEYIDINVASYGIWASTSAITSVTFSWSNGNNGSTVNGNGFYMFGAV